MERGMEDNASIPLREMNRQKLCRPRMVMGPSTSHIGESFRYTQVTYTLIANSKCSRLILKSNKWPFPPHYLDCHIKSEILNEFCHSTAYADNTAFYLCVCIREHRITDRIEIIRNFQGSCCVTVTSFSSVTNNITHISNFRFT